VAITASKLRENVYRILDEVLATGQPVEIVRGGRTLRIVPDEEPTSRLERVRVLGTLSGDPDDIVHIDWSDDWRP